MSSSGLSYALVTPARNETENLPRLAESLIAQTVAPAAWIVVDNGSTDGTLELVEALAREHPWIHALQVPSDDATEATRAEPTVIAFGAGLAELGELPDVVVKLDADISFAPDHFERLLGRFRDDVRLGLASGTCYEQQGGEWRQRHVTRGHVWGAARAYRRACLEAVLPLEAGLAWDGIDELRASVAGWQTTSFVDLPFYHHRPEAARESSLRHAWTSSGATSYYMGYRPSYLILRTLNYARREPVALAAIWGYVRSAVKQAPRYPDASVRAYLRRKQAFRNLPLRVGEAFGRHR